MRVNPIKTKEWLPPGKISVSKDKEKVKIEDWQITDGLTLDQVQVKLDLLPKILSSISSGNLNLDIKDLLKNTKIQVDKFKVTVSEGFINKILDSYSPVKEIKLTQAKIEENELKINGKILAPLLPPIPFSTYLHPNITEEGNLRFVIGKISLMAIPLPSFLKTLGLFIAKLLGLEEDNIRINGKSIILKQKNIKFTNINLKKGYLTVEGKIGKE